MYISDLYIRNYRSIKKLNIKLNKGKNVLVGKNNSGKSNIVNAIDLIMGERHTSYTNVQDKDFHIYKDEKDIKYSKFFMVSARLKGKDISPATFELFKGVSLWEMDLDTSQEDLFSNKNIKKLLRDIEYFGRGNYKPSGELYTLFIESEEIYVYFGVAKTEAVKGFRFDINNNDYSKTYSILLKKDGKFYRCPKFPKELRDILITSAVLPAFRNPATSFKINNWTWYGKLIKSVWESADEEKRAEINGKLSDIKKITDSIFKEATESIQNNIKEAIYYNTMAFQLLENTKDDIYKGVNIFIDDGVQGLAKDKGSGIQSALIISLFSYYCSEFHKNSSLLVVEEPEIYLHPQARRVLSSKLDKFISIGEESKNQVIITTHSTEFIRNVELENIIVVKKKNGETQVSSLDLDDMDIKQETKVNNIISTKNAEMFFADKVILVEGGEEYLIPLLIDHIKRKKGYLDLENITVAKVGGKSFFKPYVELLKSLEIQYCVIADFDIIENGLEQLSSFITGYDNEELSKVKEELASLVAGEDLWKSNKVIKQKTDPEVSYDGKALCKMIDEVCESKEYNEKLSVIWNHVRPKLRKKVDHQLLEKSPDVEKKVHDYIEGLRKDNIYIMKKGELENYMTSYAYEVSRREGISGQKELRIIKLVELVLDSTEKIEDLFEIEEYEEILNCMVG